MVEKSVGDEHDANSSRKSSRKLKKSFNETIRLNELKKNLIKISTEASNQENSVKEANTLDVPKQAQKPTTENKTSINHQDNP